MATMSGLLAANTLSVQMLKFHQDLDIAFQHWVRIVIIPVCSSLEFMLLTQLPIYYQIHLLMSLFIFFGKLLAFTCNTMYIGAVMRKIDLSHPTCSSFYILEFFYGNTLKMSYKYLLPEVKVAINIVWSTYNCCGWRYCSVTQLCNRTYSPAVAVDCPKNGCELGLSPAVGICAHALP